MQSLISNFFKVLPTLVSLPLFTNHPKSIFPPNISNCWGGRDQTQQPFDSEQKLGASFSRPVINVIIIRDFKFEMRFPVSTSLSIIGGTIHNILSINMIIHYAYILSNHNQLHSISTFVSLTRSLLLSFQNDRWCTCHVIKCQSIVITVKPCPTKLKNSIVAKVTNVDKRKVRMIKLLQDCSVDRFPSPFLLLSGLWRRSYAVWTSNRSYVVL